MNILVLFCYFEEICLAPHTRW